MPLRLPALRAPPPMMALLRRAFSSSAPSSSSSSSSFPSAPHSSSPAATTAAPSPFTPSSTSKLASLDRSSERMRRRAVGAQPGDVASRVISRYKTRAEAAMRSKQARLDLARNQQDSVAYLREMPRRFEAGDVYSPHDLSPTEMHKWRKRSKRNNDVVDVLGIRPLDMYKNFSLIQDFTSLSGQITHSSGTGLRPVNQRKIAKMIRRVQGMGIYPTIHDHPELIRHEFYPSAPETSQK